jgi:hypothetical protein
MFAVADISVEKSLLLMDNVSQISFCVQNISCRHVIRIQRLSWRWWKDESKLVLQKWSLSTGEQHRRK